jgi:hypothetical protein
VRGRNGNLRLPKYHKGPGLVYLGFIGPLILGAVAAVIVLVFLPLNERTRATPVGEIVTDRAYDPLRVVPLSLAAGVAGSAVLTAAQARIVGMVSQQKAEFLEATVGGSLDRAAAEASDKASEVVAAKMDQIKPQVKQMVAEARAEVPPELGADAGRRGGSVPEAAGATATSMDVDALFDAVPTMRLDSDRPPVFRFGTLGSFAHGPDALHEQRHGRYVVDCTHAH